jgi:hypothetical protein
MKDSKLVYYTKHNEPIFCHFWEDSPKNNQCLFTQMSCHEFTVPHFVTYVTLLLVFAFKFNCFDCVQQIFLDIFRLRQNKKKSVSNPTKKIDSTIDFSKFVYSKFFVKRF